jgi:hypothetical protein
MVGWPVGETVQSRVKVDRAPKPKHDFSADCQARFLGLSKRGFERALAQSEGVDRRGRLGQGWAKILASATYR